MQGHRVTRKRVFAREHGSQIRVTVRSCGTWRMYSLRTGAGPERCAGHGDIIRFGGGIGKRIYIFSDNRDAPGVIGRPMTMVVFRSVMGWNAAIEQRGIRSCKIAQMDAQTHTIAPVRDFLSLVGRRFASVRRVGFRRRSIELAMALSPRAQKREPAEDDPRPSGDRTSKHGMQRWQSASRNSACMPVADPAEAINDGCNRAETLSTT